MNAISAARRLVIKVGSALLIQDGGVDKAWLSALAGDAARLRTRGAEVLFVSSGAIALGKRRLGLGGRRVLDLEEKQAAAAAGQSILMRAWEEAHEPFGVPAAQVLLTRDDTEVRKRWLNARATLETLLRLGAAPVVNENDTVATEEIRYGDNDRLAARVAQMIKADLLVLLSDVDGLYTADPRIHKDARHVPFVGALTREVEEMAGGANLTAGVGTGGMATKLAAAAIARSAGCATLLALGHRGLQGPIEAVEAGARSTLFAPEETPQAAYKQWIAGALAPQGVIFIDAGAAAALASGKSLLPAGVVGLEGSFDKGDAVYVEGPGGRRLAKGLAAYGRLDAEKILGRRTPDLELLLGYRGASVLIHRNDLVLMGR